MNVNQRELWRNQRLRMSTDSSLCCLSSLLSCHLSFLSAWARQSRPLRPLWPLWPLRFPPAGPPPQKSGLNHCLHLICCLNTKSLSSSHFLLPPRRRPDEVHVHVHVHEEPPEELDLHIRPPTCRWSSAELFTSSSVCV